MPLPTREQVYQALVALTEEVTWGTAPTKQFLNAVATRRRVKLFSDATIQPAVYQAEHDEEVAQVTNLPYKRAFKASWIVYQNVGKDHSAVPAIENNLILDAIQAAQALGASAKKALPALGRAKQHWNPDVAAAAEQATKAITQRAH